MQIISSRDVGNCVRRERRRRGMTQQALADRVMVSRTFISQLESGKPTVELALALRVLAMLDVELTAQPGGPRRATLRPGGVDLDRILDGLGSIDG